MKSVFEKIVALLEDHAISYELTEHEAAFTSEEAARVRGVEQHLGTKAMIMRTKQGTFLFALPADKRIDMRKVKKMLGVRDASLMEREEAEKFTGLKMGCVPPFGKLFGITMYLDKKVLDNSFIYFSAGSHTTSLKMKSDDLVSVNEPILADFIKE